MSDNLKIFGQNWSNVTGFKATDTNNNVLTYIRPQGNIALTQNTASVDVSAYATASVSVSGNYQTKTGIVPSTSSVTVLPDTPTYDALASVTVDGDADLIASNIKNGVTIFGVTGTFQGGGGGGNFTVESGTWSPSADASSSIIPFTNTHTDPPFFYVIRDTTSTASGTTRDNGVVTYVNFAQYFGTPYIVSSTITVYGLVGTRYKSSRSGTGGGTFHLTTPYTDSSSTTSVNHSQYWATSSGIKLYTNSTNRLNRTSRTFSWMAMWKNS